MGPLLFLVYVNAMPSLVKYGRLLQLAHNTTLICSVTFTNLMNNDSGRSMALHRLVDVGKLNYMVTEANGLTQ